MDDIVEEEVENEVLLELEWDPLHEVALINLPLFLPACVGGAGRCIVSECAQWRGSIGLEEVEEHSFRRVSASSPAIRAP